MSVALTNITGGAQTGMTSPVFTVAADNAPNATTGKQWQIIGLTSGSAAGVRFHSISDPFTVLFERPSVLRTMTFSMLNGLTGLVGQVPFNVYTGICVKKGVNVAANNPPRVADGTCRVRIPAGADSYDSPNVRALWSVLSGASFQQSPGIGDMLVSGTI